MYLWLQQYDTGLSVKIMRVGSEGYRKQDSCVAMVTEAGY